MIRPWCVTLSALSMREKSFARRMSHDTPLDSFEQLLPFGSSPSRLIPKGAGIVVRVQCIRAY